MRKAATTAGPHAPWFIMAAVLFFGACSVAPAGVEIHDPYEASNRETHAFNKALDSAALRTAGQASRDLPDIIRIPVVNFSRNTGLPSAILNNILQGDIGGAATNTMRFILNTTVGVLGLADPAGAIGLYEVKADFGGTLARWGVPEGAYLELPVLGPSTERDAAGEVIDALLNPLGRLGSDRFEPLQRLHYPAWVAEQVIDRGRFGDTVDSVLHESADSYAQTRLIYLQNRRHELSDATDDAYIDPYGGGSAYIDPYEDLP